MAISLPKERTYYLEPQVREERVLLWIPKNILRDMVRVGAVSGNLAEDHPLGLEMNLREAGQYKEQYGLNLSVDPDKARKTFLEFYNAGLIGERGISAELLEAIVENGGKFPGPKMSDGEDALTVLRRISQR